MGLAKAPTRMPKRDLGIDDIDQFIRVERLFKERHAGHRPDSAPKGIPKTCDHDDGNITLFANRPRKRNPVTSRHVQIRNDEINGLVIKSRQSLGPRNSRDAIETDAPQPDFQGVHQRFVVIDDQYPLQVLNLHQAHSPLRYCSAWNAAMPPLARLRVELSFGFIGRGDGPINRNLRPARSQCALQRLRGSPVLATRSAFRSIFLRIKPRYRKSFFTCPDPSPGGIKELTQGALWSKNDEKRVLSRPEIRCQRCHSPRARCFSSPPKKSTDPKKTHFGCYSISVFPVFFIVLDDSKWLS